jgi:hypothetical protein
MRSVRESFTRLKKCTIVQGGIANGLAPQCRSHRTKTQPNPIEQRMGGPARSLYTPERCRVWKGSTGIESESFDGFLS